MAVAKVSDPPGDTPDALANVAPSAYELLGALAGNLHKRDADTVTAKEAATPPEPADPIDSYIDAAADMLALPVEPAWKPAVKANLLVNLRLAAVVADFPLPDEAEPAPVFKA